MCELVLLGVVGSREALAAEGALERPVAAVGAHVAGELVGAAEAAIGEVSITGRVCLVSEWQMRRNEEITERVLLTTCDIQPGTPTQTYRQSQPCHEQLYGFSPVCRRTWFLRCEAFWYDWPHPGYVQAWGLPGLPRTTMSPAATGAGG